MTSEFGSSRGKAGTGDDSTHREELKFPEWQIPLRDVLLEFDREKLTEEIQQVETLLSERLGQLGQAAEAHNERDAINGALRILRTIQRDKLGFPDWEDRRRLR